MSPLIFSDKDPADSLKNRYSSVFGESGFLKVRMIVNRAGIIHLSFNELFHQRALTMIGKLIPNAKPGPPAGSEQFRGLVRQLLSSEQGPAPDFEANPFLKNGTTFQRRVWRLISELSPGETITYGELAVAAGSPGGARAVGNACNQNPLALIIPCHRVVAANGLGGFAGDLSVKRKLLELEKKRGKKTKFHLTGEHITENFQPQFHPLEQVG
jgi:methylated-DNA-[protein]-cysteine S-methyltransferase